MSLGDIAHITRGYIDPSEAKMFTNGVPSLGLAVSLREGGDISRLGVEVDALLARLRTAYPIGVDLEVRDPMVNPPARDRADDRAPAGFGVLGDVAERVLQHLLDDLRAVRLVAFDVDAAR